MTSRPEFPRNRPSESVVLPSNPAGSPDTRNLDQRKKEPSSMQWLTFLDRRAVRIAFVIAALAVVLVASVAMASGAGPAVLPVEPDGGIGGPIVLPVEPNGGIGN
jgi:hypothetical protein